MPVQFIGIPVESWQTARDDEIRPWKGQVGTRSTGSQDEGGACNLNTSDVDIDSPQTCQDLRSRIACTDAGQAPGSLKQIVTAKQEMSRSACGVKHG